MAKKWLIVLFKVLYEVGAFAAIYFMMKIYADSVV